MMSSPQRFIEDFVSGTDCVLLGTCSEDAGNIDEAWFTIREDWATDADEAVVPSDSNAVGQLKLSTGGITIVDGALELVIPSALTRTMRRRTYCADLKVKTTTGRILPAAVGQLRRIPNAGTATS